MKKYQIFCTTENKWHYVASNNAITKCPVDGAHSFNSHSIGIVDDDYVCTVSDYSELSLDDYKQVRLKEINKRNNELISSGFSFDSNTFNIGDKSRGDWIGIKTLESLLTFPMDITTKDDGAYSLTQANLDAFLGTGLSTYQGILDSGRTLKTQINAATTEAEVDAVVDNR